MASACFSIIDGKAKARAEQSFGEIAPPVRFTDAVMQKARALWPAKTAAEIAVRAHVSVRGAEHWLGASREISTEALIHLLRSEEGIHFLVALMGKARPRWWSALLRMGVLGSIQRRREADLRLLRRVANADQSSAPQFATALLFQDEDFYRPLLAGFSAHEVASGKDRAVAASSKKGGR